MKEIKRKNGQLKNPALTVATLVFALAIGLIVANAVTLYKNSIVAVEHRQLVSLSHEVETRLESVLLLLSDTESGLRGYFITGDRRMLEPIQSMRSQINMELAALQSIIVDESVRGKIPLFATAVNDRLKKLDELQDINRTQGLAGARDWIAGMHGTQSRTDVKSLADVIRQEIKRLQGERLLNADNSYHVLSRSFLFSNILMGLFSCLVYAFLRGYFKKQKEEHWLSTAKAQLNEAIRGELTLEQLGYNVLKWLSTHLKIRVGTFYALAPDSQALQLASSYGILEPTQLKSSFAPGEGLVGEAARQKKQLETHPRDSYLKIGSALGDMQPADVVISPVLLNNDVKGVIELGAEVPFDALQMSLLEQTQDMIGIAIHTVQNRDQLRKLLQETERQASELQEQREELRVTNEELEEQAKALQASQSRLQMQQEELRQTNEELESQARALEAQTASLSRKNRDLEEAQTEIERKARDLEIASKYKSDFLANMSHELRTPLNSILLLSTLLAENRRGKLSEQEIEFARTISNSGNDLLTLINDILDLSKVEAGRLDLNKEDIQLEQVTSNIRGTFTAFAQRQGLAFDIETGPGIPSLLHTDQNRLEQILRNFLSNAFKFTERGSVKLWIGHPNSVTPYLERQGAKPETTLAFRVTDTGIGIAQEKLEIIFEAFHQIDGSSNRKYGGTGLGLTISRELARLLGGDIDVVSEPGKGSSFTLYVPEVAARSSRILSALPARPPQPLDQRPAPSVLPMPAAAMAKATAVEQPSPPLPVDDDRNSITADDRVLLIIEDDTKFSRVLLQSAHDYGFKGLLAHDGETGLAMIEKYHPAAVLLDIKLPGMHGLSVLEKIKANHKLRNIPIHVISGLDYANSALKLGAVGYLQKPATSEKLRAAFEKIEKTIARRIGRLLVIEDDRIQQESICQYIGSERLECQIAGSGGEAIDRLRQEQFDCIVLDLRLPDCSGFELLEKLNQDESISSPPVIVYTGKDLSKDEVERLQKYSETIILKGARSPQRLLDEVTLFLHRVDNELPKQQQKILSAVQDESKRFEGRTILLVDDDLRNVFALLSALEGHGLKVQVARNGLEALEKIGAEPGIDLVLMDIMMPVMDGYEAMQKIRENPKFRKLPIIALTAKAMKGDYEKCIEAGANDYLAKPIDFERLLSILKVWLPLDGGI